MEVPNQERWNTLANMAAAEAKHDLDDTSRTKQSTGIFTEVSKKHKDIGTPTPYTEPIASEYEMLNMHLQFSDTPSYETLKEKYFNGAFVSEEIRVRDIAYEVSSLRLNVDTMPSELMDFLAPTEGETQRDVAFCVDTDSCRIRDIFEKPENAAIKRTAYYVSPREFMNDGADKADRSLTKTISNTDDKNHSVEVVSVIDSLPETVEYGATNLDSPDPTFYSIFDITLGPIRENKLNIIFRNGDFEEKTTVIQKDKSTWNTLKTHAESIYRWFKSQFNKDYRKYYTLLQNKRSGDWLQVLSCTDKYRENRYKGLPNNIPIILVTSDILCAAYAIEVGVDCIFTSNSRGDKLLLYIRKKQAYEILSDEQRLATMVEALPKPDEAQEYLMNASYRQARDAFIAYRETVVSQIKESLPDSLELANVEQRIKDAFKAYGRLVSLRIGLREVEAAGEEARDTLKRASLYKKNLSSLKHILKGDGEMVNRIKRYIDRQLTHRGETSIDSAVNHIRVFKRRNVDTLQAVCYLFRDYMTEEEADAFIKFLEKPLVFLKGDDEKSYKEDFLATAKYSLTLKGNGPNVPNWVLVTAIVEPEIEPLYNGEEAVAPNANADVAPNANAEVVAPNANAEVIAPNANADVVPNASPEALASGAESPHGSLDIQLSRTYGPSMILGLRFRNKCDKTHRIDSCEGRRHVTYTTTILFLHHLLRLVDDVNSRKLADPSYESVNEFALKYVSQWLIHILNSLPGHTKDIFKEVECFILGMILDHESRLKDSPYLIELIQRFMRDVYGYETDTYKVKECHFIDKSDFVKGDAFEETKPYTSIMEELKHHIHQTLGFLREYEEDPARLVEFRAKQAAIEESKRRLEEAHLETVKAAAVDGVARETVLERSAELISTQEDLKRSIEEERTASREVKKKLDIESREKQDVRKGVREALRMVRNAQRRGRRSAAVKRVQRHIKTRRKTNDDFTNATLKRMGRELGLQHQRAREGSFVA